MNIYADRETIIVFEHDEKYFVQVVVYTDDGMGLTEYHQKNLMVTDDFSTSWADVQAMAMSKVDEYEQSLMEG